MSPTIRVTAVCAVSEVCCVEAEQTEDQDSALGDAMLLVSRSDTQVLFVSCGPHPSSFTSVSPLSSEGWFQHHPSLLYWMNELSLLPPGGHRHIHVKVSFINLLTVNVETLI